MQGGASSPNRGYALPPGQHKQSYAEWERNKKVQMQNQNFEIA